MKFFDKLFNRSTESAPEPVKPESKSNQDIVNEFISKLETDDLFKLKFSKLITAFKEYNEGKLLTADQILTVKEALIANPESIMQFNDAVGENISYLAKDLASEFGWQKYEQPENDWEPGKDLFTPMAPAKRQIAFEAGLMEFLGRKPSTNELTLARQEFIRGGEEARTRYSTMVGEDANLYGQEIAKRINQQRESN